MNADFGTIQLVSPDQKTLSIVVQEGFNQDFLDAFSEVSTSDACACGRAFRSNRRLVLEDVEADPEYEPYKAIARAAGYRSVQSTPLLSSTGTPLGIVCTHWKSLHRPTEQDLRRLDLYCLQAAEFILRCRTDQKLRDQKEQMLAILNTASDAIITIDKRGMITSCNFAAQKMFGYDSSDMLGRNVSMLMPQPYSTEHDRYLSQYQATGQKRIIGVGREAMARRKDGTTFPVDLAVSEVDNLGLFTGIIRDISERKKLQQDILSIVEEEQRRIGQDLHDGAQQELAGVSLLTQVLVNHIENVSKAPTLEAANYCKELAIKIRSGLARAHQEIRSVARGLNPISVDATGLMNALREMSERTDELECVNCDFKCDGTVTIDDNFVANQLYRIAQEAVTNALKHGQPRHITIELTSADSQCILKITDDGMGFNHHSVQSGLGLKTMRYRASLLGGALLITPAANGGTAVTCKINTGGRTDAKQLNNK